MEKRELLRKIPSVDKLLKELPEKIKRENPENLIKESIKKALAKIREEIRRGKPTEIDSKIIMEKIEAEIEKDKDFKLKPVINATGVIIHTNLGRAPLNEEVAEHLRKIVTEYCNLELDIETGKRGLRYQNVEELLKELTGAESVCIVNNNAAAVLLVLSTLAKGKEVIVSRGELIEIGGSFRIPDVMEQSGAILKEVGTTNKTHLHDYENAINENTGLLMKVHTSNYKILGFTKSVNGKKLADLAQKYKIPVYEDIGSGSFIDVEKFNLSHEPTVQEVIKSGVDIVSFSGDKLLGGPQAGIIVGKKELMEKIRKHPLNRALRIDKMTLAVLEATLKLYKHGRFKEIPVWKAISESENKVKKRAKILTEKLKNITEVKIIEEWSEIGGGALPLEKLKTFAVAVKVENVEEFYQKLRKRKHPIMGRIKDEFLLFDMRTVKDTEIEEIFKAIKETIKY